MLSVSVKEFLFWKKKQLSKGGDNQSLFMLLECIGGISKSDLNSLALNNERNLNISFHWDLKFSNLNDYSKYRLNNQVKLQKIVDHHLLKVAFFSTIKILLQKCKAFIKVSAFWSKSTFTRVRVEA